MKNGLAKEISPEVRLYACLKKRYEAGAKTLVMDREEAEIVLDMFRQKARVRRAIQLLNEINEITKNNRGAAEVHNIRKG